MDKKELIKSVVVKSGVREQDVSKVMDSILESIIESVSSGKRITIKHFGSFLLKENACRQRYNPRNGTYFTAPDNKRIVFKPSESICLD